MMEIRVVVGPPIMSLSLLVVILKSANSEKLSLKACHEFGAQSTIPVLDWVWQGSFINIVCTFERDSFGNNHEFVELTEVGLYHSIVSRATSYKNRFIF